MRNSSMVINNKLLFKMLHCRHVSCIGLAVSRAMNLKPQ